MRMYAVIDSVFRQEACFRTIEEAEKEIDSRRRYDREFTMENSDGIPGRDYLTIQIVERDSQPCKVCGGEATNKPEQYAEYPYCRNCYHTGSAADDQHMNDLSYFRQAFPDAEVGVEHTGGGCFWLAFRWEDDPFYYAATAGDACVPEDGKWADGWGAVCGYYQDEADNEATWNHPYYEGKMLLYKELWDEKTEVDLPGLTKRQVIAAIKKDRKARAAA